MNNPSSALQTVVHVAGQLEYGGLEKLLVEFARRVDRTRFRLHFVSLTSRGPVAGELESHGWPVTALEFGEGLHPAEVIRLRNLLRRIRATVVHTHNTRALLYAGPAAKLARVKRIIHTRHGQSFGKSKRDRWLRRIGSQLADTVVCVSHDSRRLAGREGIAASRLRTIWNGIDATRFIGAQPQGGGPAIAVGRLSPEKDFATLIRAAALVVAEAPEFSLQLAGGGACEGQIRELSISAGLGSSIKLLGPVSDIPGLMASGSLFVLSSLTEGISLTILEAMAAGLPVVATAVGGNPEVIADKVTGLLVPAGDPRRLADALLELWRDTGKRATLGEAGRQRVRELFDIRRTVAAYELLYDRSELAHKQLERC
jgi:glycosyltransferase involved in cell wall biosynthesis